MRVRHPTAVLAVTALALASAACSEQLPTATPAPPVPAPTQVPPGPTHTGALPPSTAPATEVQPQRPPGSCHALGSGLFSEPDPHCTPGALNPAVTPATIHQTICKPGWTKTVRPPERITYVEKRRSLAAYADPGPLRAYEYDHLVSLELGGAVNDPRNLWPEPGGAPNPKDKIANILNREVCRGETPLAQAQQLIAEQWVPYYRKTVGPTG